MKKRIFHIAKELNISHTEIINFLKKKGQEISSHMMPVDEPTYSMILEEFSKDKLECILYLIDKYGNKNDEESLTIISSFVELFYKDLFISKNKDFNIYSMKKNKLLEQINDAKRFSLDKKNLFTSLISTLYHETK